ncbi:MAG: DUF2520 domain-containing protein [Proteobacteria bacterium]|jgi:predicted short-subunit dehydrogenase-like oxidoreductase (DUF2520 family)|nr:DUF2520 domain-containing protein [Pseudomonadota bacterium]
MDIGIIGPGRLGRSLGFLFDDVGHRVILVGPGDSQSELGDCDVVLLTVPDDSIETVAGQLSTRGVVLHCSGATDVEPLRPHHPAGSMHPLMTFPGPDISIPNLKGVHAAVAGDPKALTMARDLAKILGMIPTIVEGDRRLYHASAVMAGNFATVIFAQAATILEKAEIKPSLAREMLAPLAKQSISNATANPRDSLTGPVARGDTAIINAHRSALQEAGLADLLTLYDNLSHWARELKNSA